MAGLTTRKLRSAHKSPTPAQRLERWIKKHAVPPAHMTKRPLQFQLPKKVVEANGFYIEVVWLTVSGELRLDDPDNGIIIGNVLR